MRKDIPVHPLIEIFVLHKFAQCVICFKVCVNELNRSSFHLLHNIGILKNIFDTRSIPICIQNQSWFVTQPKDLCSGSICPSLEGDIFFFLTSLLDQFRYGQTKHFFALNMRRTFLSSILFTQKFIEIIFEYPRKITFY